MATDSSVLMVVVMKDGSLVGSEVFPSGTYRLGRGDDMDLVLDDARVSHHHASFLFTNGQIGIRDEGSQNGIFVNGEKVKSARVNPRDEVEIAPFVLKMRLVQKRKETEPFDRAMVSPPREVTAPLRAIPTPSSQAIGEDTDEPTVLQPDPRISKQTAVARVSQAAPLSPNTPPRGSSLPGRSGSRPDPTGLLQPRPIPRGVSPSGAAAPAHQRTPAPAPSPALAPVSSALPEMTDNGDHPPFQTTVTVRRPKGLAVPVPKAPPTRRVLPHPMPPPTDTELKSGKVLTQPVLRVQLLWGDLESASVVVAHTFSPGDSVVAGPSDSFPVPVYGFPGEKSRYRLAKYKGGKWRVTVPEGVELFVRSGQGYAHHDHDGTYELAEQESVVLRHAGVGVELISELASARIAATFKPKIEKSYVIPLGIALFLVGTMMIWSRTMKDLPDFQPKMLPPPRVVLQAPKKKKPEAKKETKKDEPEKKKEEKKPEVAKKEPPKPNKPLAIQPPPAAAAVAKLLNTNKLLSAVTNIGKAGKMGNNMNYKASGLIAAMPLGMTGPGNILGLGKGMGGGGVMGGIGFAGLRGAGGMGKGNVGRRGVASVPVTIPSGQRKVQGTLPMEAVQKVVDEHMGAIRRCYEGALVRNPSIAGKLVFEWTIGTDGNVKIAKTKLSTMPSADVGDCIRSSLVTWHFPLPKGGVVVVSYPFLFNAVGT